MKLLEMPLKEMEEELIAVASSNQARKHDMNTHTLNVLAYELELVLSDPDSKLSDEAERAIAYTVAALRAQPSGSCIGMPAYEGPLSATQAPDLTHARIAEDLIDRIRELEAKLAASAEPVAWVAADTLNSPHPTCVSSLAYISQLDKDRGREYVPLYAAPVAAQTADDARDALVEMVHEMFRSGNSVPVERITITRKQYDAAMKRTTPQEGSKQ